MIKYVSFDPGKTTGIVCWDEEGKDKGIFEFQQRELDYFLIGLEANPPEVFICEEYVIYGSVNHTGSKVETIQVIGQLKAFARKFGIEWVEQRSDIKKIASLWSGVKSNRAHMEDWMAAYLHGYYYLHNIDVIKARVLEDD